VPYQHSFPPPQGLYDPRHEHDACGVAALEAHRAERAIRAPGECELLAGPDMAQCGGVILRIEYALEIVRSEALLAEDIGKRLAGANRDHVPIRLARGTIGADRGIGLVAQIRQVEGHRRVGYGRRIVAGRVREGRDHDADEGGQQHTDATEDPVFCTPADRRSRYVLQERPVRHA
jgi:hypothetical protein